MKVAQPGAHAPEPCRVNRQAGILVTPVVRLYPWPPVVQFLIFVTLKDVPMQRQMICVCLAVAFGIAAVPRAADEADWKPLFDGKSLAGWTQKGGKARYRVEGNEIIGSSVPNTGNSFLCTEQEYGDFVLEIEFEVDPKLNSGIQIRSHCFDEPKEVQHDGKAIKIPAGRVHGYQVEIDPSERAWSGGIYDEGRRGWLNDLKENEPARKAFLQGEWNKFRIECQGESIKTWINDVPAADLKDGMTPKGFIALQVHGVGDNPQPLEVRWRNIRIKPLSAA